MSTSTVMQSTSPSPARSLPMPELAGRSRRAVVWFVGLAALLLAADLVSKELAFRYVAGVPVVDIERSAGSPREHQQFWARYPHQPIVVIPGLLHLQLTTNTGAVFGLGKGFRWGFVAASVVAVAVIARVFHRSRAGAWLLHAALAMVLAGALGNLYDRIRYQAVRDMLHMLPGTQLWPWIFNIADVALVVGVALLAVLLWFGDRVARGQDGPAAAGSATP